MGSQASCDLSFLTSVGQGDVGKTLGQLGTYPQARLRVSAEAWSAVGGKCARGGGSGGGRVNVRCCLREQCSRAPGERGPGLTPLPLLSWKRPLPPLPWKAEVCAAGIPAPIGGMDGAQRRGVWAPRVWCAVLAGRRRPGRTGQEDARAVWGGRGLPPAAAASLGLLHPELNDGACFCRNLCRILHRVCPGYSACSVHEQPGAEGLWGLPSAGVNASTPLTVALHRPGCRSGSCARAAPQTN